VLLAVEGARVHGGRASRRRLCRGPVDRPGVPRAGRRARACLGPGGAGRRSDPARRATAAAASARPGRAADRRTGPDLGPGRAPQLRGRRTLARRRRRRPGRHAARPSPSRCHRPQRPRPEPGMSARPADLRSAGPALRRTLAYLRPHLRPQRPLVAGGFVALFAEVAFRILEPWPLKFVIDAVIAPGASGEQPGTVRLLVLCALAVVAVAGLRALSAYAMTVCFALAGTRTMTAVRAEVYAHALRLSLRFHNRTRSGDLINRLISDVGKLRDVAVTAAMPLIGNVVTLVA